MKKLTAKQQRFVDEYLVDLNASAAARRAGYSEKTARVIADENLTKPDIQAAIASAMKARSARTQIDQDRIVRELWHVLTADANGLVEYRRTCCRYCYGAGHRYQFTAGEMEIARREHAAFVLKAQQDETELPAELLIFNERGGIGFDPRKPPVDDCPECFGEGEGEVFVKDTRDLSPELRSLYAGVKRTKEGLEVKMHDKTAALTLAMRHLGMLNDKLELSKKPRVRVVDQTGRKSRAKGD
ncbi:terminase small subunit [Burkholderia pseudomallei MSHR7498]|uniref:terminase small subunit n=1 Tax=Burkholderia pseudomallei TaxID=28450 RepID=UPI000530E39A|nr:terminase small subunit [Burkholderia pseudomallei]KGS94937.1 terminase small subunit [Burkholderia pseudomallei MSHR7498]